MSPPLPEHQFAEVFVRRDQQGTPVVGLLQNPVVCDARGELGHVEDLVAVVPQSFHYGPIYAFIRKQVHADCAPTG